MDDNSGMLLNPQKFRLSMPSVFGPAEIHIVLATIFNSCVKCAFQQTSFIRRILDIFPTPKDENKDLYTEIKRMLKKRQCVFFSSKSSFPLSGKWNNRLHISTGYTRRLLGRHSNISKRNFIW